MYLALANGLAGFTQGSTCPALLRIPLSVTSTCPYGTITPYGAAFQPLPVRRAVNIVVLQPRHRRNGTGLGCSDFARHYSRNHSCFLFLRLLRCFSSAGSPTLRCDRPSTCRVAPFGHPRINARVQLPVDFRSLSRPSSPLEA